MVTITYLRIGHVFKTGNTSEINNHHYIIVLNNLVKFLNFISVILYRIIFKIKLATHNIWFYERLSISQYISEVTDFSAFSWYSYLVYNEKKDYINLPCLSPASIKKKHQYIFFSQLYKMCGNYDLLHTFVNHINIMCLFLPHVSKRVIHFLTFCNVCMFFFVFII